MRDAKLPLAYRDSCANLLIPLNRCRFETYYMPWKCEVRLTVYSKNALGSKLLGAAESLARGASRCPLLMLMPRLTVTG